MPRRKHNARQRRCCAVCLVVAYFDGPVCPACRQVLEPVITYRLQRSGRWPA